jgi:tetratricopeptide (TPR) repeat protein
LFKIKNIYLLLMIASPELFAQSLLSKVWHNSVSHYNYYYNANLLVSDVREETLIGYKDNFKDVLSLYPIADQNTLKGNATRMDEVLKKASHIIEKHGKSKWVDDSYLLMGDARLFKGDFYSAVEVYEYVANNFKGSEPAAQAEINLVTTYLLMEKYEDAEALYTKLNAKKGLNEKMQVQLDVAGAAVNIKQGKYAVAIKLLEKAIPKVKNKNQKIRYNFVLAQLYHLTNKSTESLARYRKVIKLNPPYEFAFHAKLNMAKSINVKNRGEIKNAKVLLRDMLRDDKNKEYFDQIYYELGNLEIADKNERGAVAEYTNALRANGSDLGIKSSAYLALADLYFRQQNYEYAQVYYDSAARTVDPANPNYEAIQNKNLVLNELIKHLVNIKEKDSLLRLSNDERLLEKTIDKLIKEKKNKAEAVQQDEELRKQQMNNMSAGSMPGQSPIVNTNFPFYNQAARTKGLQDFQRIWGNRPLNDFWAISSNKTVQWNKTDNEMKTNDKGGAIKEDKVKNAPEERKPYYDNIPFTVVDKQRVKDEIAESYFLGANVYYQDLKEYDKAKKMLEDLNTKFPGNKFEINSWYLLARIYGDQKNQPKVDYYVDLIRKADPKSNFLNVLLNLESTDSSAAMTERADKEVETLYGKAFSAYKAKNYDEAMSVKKDNDSKFPGNPLQVNFDYLEALILGEKGDLPGFERKLQAIVDNYPGTPIAEQSGKTILLIKSKNGQETGTNENAKYNFNAAADHFYMVLVPKGTDVTQLKITFLNYNKSFFPDDGLRVTNSILGEQYQIMIVNNFKSLEQAKSYISKLIGNKQFFADAKIDNPQQYLISKDNFSTLITDKLLEDYLKFYKIHYTF